MPPPSFGARVEHGHFARDSRRCSWAQPRWLRVADLVVGEEAHVFQCPVLRARPALQRRVGVVGGAFAAFDQRLHVGEVVDLVGPLEGRRDQRPAAGVDGRDREQPGRQAAAARRRRRARGSARRAAPSAGSTSEEQQRVGPGARRSPAETARRALEDRARPLEIAAACEPAGGRYQIATRADSGAPRSVGGEPPGLDSGVPAHSTGPSELTHSDACLDAGLGGLSGIGKVGVADAVGRRPQGGQIGVDGVSRHAQHQLQRRALARGARSRAGARRRCWAGSSRPGTQRGTRSGVLAR